MDRSTARSVGGSAGPTLSDGQMRNDFIVRPAVGRVLRERIPDHPGELAEQRGRVRVQPQDVLTEPARAPQAAVERVHRCNGCGEAAEKLLVDCEGRDERIQDGEMSGDAPTCRRVQTVTVLANDWLRARDRHYHRRFRRQPRIGRRVEIPHPMDATDPARRPTHGSLRGACQ